MKFFVSCVLCFFAVSAHSHHHHITITHDVYYPYGFERVHFTLQVPETDQTLSVSLKEDEEFTFAFENPKGPVVFRMSTRTPSHARAPRHVVTYELEYGKKYVIKAKSLYWPKESWMEDIVSQISGGWTVLDLYEE